MIYNFVQAQLSKNPNLLLVQLILGNDTLPMYIADRYTGITWTKMGGR